jgi:prepilin-type N-terminal cleavage/methylation domain-containing protein
MKTAAFKSTHKAFTLRELLVVLAVVSLLAFMLLPALAKAKAYRNPIRCNNNLKQIALSFKMYAGDCDQRFPQFNDSDLGSTGLPSTNPPPAVWKYFRALSNELGSAAILVCPDDVLRNKNYATDFSDRANGLGGTSKRDTAASYFVGMNAVETKPNALLVGDRNLSPAPNAGFYRSTNGASVDVAADAFWHTSPQEPFHKKEGFYALADGSVQRANSDRLQEALRLARQSYGSNANHILFPQ